MCCVLFVCFGWGKMDIGSSSHVLLFSTTCTKGGVQNVMHIGTARPSSRDLLDMTFLWLMSVDSVLLLKVRRTTSSAKRVI
jgi:hypothetical protein